ncbi:MAG: PIN domain-containing protein [Elusimicrobiota bacterium]|nr:PIN domain-containing protein [Elusimicrobiota bacterium]
MKILVDTCVWSAALRRSKQSTSKVTVKLSSLISDHRVEIIGPIRQEILSGIREKAQFKNLKKYLAAFPDIPLNTEDYVTAAEFYNLCRSRGVQGSNTDFLICAVAIRKHLTIFTTDRDFSLFAKYLPIILF